MISDGMAAVLRSLLRYDGVDLARACARALRADGVALSALVGAERMAEPVWHYPEVSARFEELQFTLGEGPGPDAVRAGSPVLEPDLGRVRPDRWPELLRGAQELGVHGVCCFPLSVGAIRVGVLTVLSAPDRRLGAQQAMDARALAAALTGALLNGDRRSECNGGGPGPGPTRLAGLNRPAVHQATGMISVQLAVSMEEALLRLRAHAYSSGRPLGEVSADVVARRLRFDDGYDGYDDEFDDDEDGPCSPGGGEE